MTGKKRQRYDHLPIYRSELFDLKLDFIGDFTSGPPARFELEGSREKKSFSVKYFVGEKVRGMLLCNRAEDQSVEAAKMIRAQYVKT